MRALPCYFSESLVFNLMVSWGEVWGGIKWEIGSEYIEYAFVHDVHGSLRPMDCSPAGGLQHADPVHCLLAFDQIHAHHVGDVSFPGGSDGEDSDGLSPSYLLLPLLPLPSSFPASGSYWKDLIFSLLKTLLLLHQVC